MTDSGLLEELEQRILDEFDNEHVVSGGIKEGIRIDEDDLFEYNELTINVFGETQDAAAERLAQGDLCVMGVIRGFIAAAGPRMSESPVPAGTTSRGFKYEVSVREVTSE